jgi:1-acyl-sn-glycerol-3-phosphate acyltransferase
MKTQSNKKTGGAKLLMQRRFGPLFWTQFCGAFNDNLYKNALVILITFKAYQIAELSPEQLVALCGGIFILPFFLFSALAGQISDQVSKSRLMMWIKVWEIGVMTLGSIGFVTENFPLLIGVLFLMGLQSTFFGPAKYSSLPELLPNRELVTGNAYVEMGTFLAILLGTILGGLLVSMPRGGGYLISAAVMAFAAMGWLNSLRIPSLPPIAQAQPLQLNIFKSTADILRICRRTRSVFLSILGISWFWLVGAVVLSILPAYCKETLNANEHVVTFFLALFSLGVGIGSIFCEKLSFNHLELGLVPIGSFGISLFALDLFLVGQPSLQAPLVTVGVLLGTPVGWRITVDLLLFSLFSGFFIVPLYTLIQERSEDAVRSQTIAANNILNALFMVVGALLLTLLLAAGATLPQIFLVIALLNLAVAAYIYSLIPEFLYRFMCWILAHCLYRLRVQGRANIPLSGPAVLVCNHVTYVDWLIMASATQRPVRFVMHYSFLNIPLTGRIFRNAKVIPIAGSRENATILNNAFDQISKELRAGEIVCIYPEGQLTHDGDLNPFRNGIERIIQRDPVPVIPTALQGLWGSLFSRKHRRLGQKLRHNKLWSRVELQIGQPVAPEKVNAPLLQEKVASLLARVG